MISRREISLERFARRVSEWAAGAGEDISVSLLVFSIQKMGEEAEATLDGTFIDNPDPHCHEAYYDMDGRLTDICARCGRDIRNDLHSDEAVEWHSMGKAPEKPEGEGDDG